MSYLYVLDLEKELEDLEIEQENANLDDEDEARLIALRELDEELGGFATFVDNFSDGLIPESEFEDYAAELAYDTGMVERNAQISYYVDWERWSDDCKMDYSAVEFDGETYLYR